MYTYTHGLLHYVLQVHHPGSKQQLEEVWEKQDHVDTEFNPKTFFFLHGIMFVFVFYPYSIANFI